MTFDRFNFTTSYTFQAGASASLKFNGTAAYFMSYGTPPPEQDTYQAPFDEKSELYSLPAGISNGSWATGVTGWTRRKNTRL